MTDAEDPRTDHPETRGDMLVVRGAVTPERIPRLCAQVRDRLADPSVTILTCDLRGVTNADAGAIDGLARMQLTARRMGCAIRLRHVHRNLRALLRLAGMGTILPAEPDLPDSPGDDPPSQCSPIIA